MNQYIISGNLAYTPELQEGKKKPFVSFTIINNHHYLDKETGAYETIKTTMRCISFGKTAERVCKYLRKGSWCVLKGKLSTGSYKDKDLEQIISQVLDDGDAQKVATRYTTELIVNEFEIDSGVARQVRQRLMNKTAHHPNEREASHHETY